jgi:hypothetical protein
MVGVETWVYIQAGGLYRSVSEKGRRGKEWMDEKRREKKKTGLFPVGFIRGPHRRIKNRSHRLTIRAHPLVQGC